MITRRLTLVLAATLALTAPALAQQQGGGKKGAGNDPFAETPAAYDIAGNYYANGRYPDGSAYEGRVQIGQQGNKVSINWTIGGSDYSGQGVIDGRVVAVDWGDSTPIVYVVMANGALHGTWNDGLALEKLSPN